jgi:hypothetical protein
MTTKLSTSLRREIDLDGDPVTVVLTPEGVRLSRKRFREGRTLSWSRIWELAELERATGTLGAARRIQ